MATAESTVPLPEIPSKTCHTCGKLFPATWEYFHRYNSVAGFRSDCRRCWNAKRQMWNYLRSLSRPRKRATHVPMPPAPDGYKNCYQCRQVLPATPKYFWQDRSTKDGWQTRCRLCKQQYKKLHPEQAHRAYKKYRETNREKVLAGYRTYGILHADRVKAKNRRYRHANPEKIRKHWSDRRTRKRSLPVHYTEAMWQAACTYFQQTCAICGREEGLFWRLAQDHWVPLSDPACPGTVATNIVPLCHPKTGSYQSCNSTKERKDPHTWLVAKLGPRKAREMLTKIEAFFAYMEQCFPS